MIQIVRRVVGLLQGAKYVLTQLWYTRASTIRVVRLVEKGSSYTHQIQDAICVIDRRARNAQ